MVGWLRGLRCGCGLSVRRLPFPGQQLVQPGLRDFGDAREHVGEPDLGIDVVSANGDVLSDAKPKRSE